VGLAPPSFFQNILIFLRNVMSLVFGISLSGIPLSGILLSGILLSGIPFNNQIPISLSTPESIPPHILCSMQTS
jgi:hypothetical protein